MRGSGDSRLTADAHVRRLCASRPASLACERAAPCLRPSTQRRARCASAADEVERLQLQLQLW